jgi:hypothetical protein
MMVAAINIADNIFTMRFQFYLVGHLVALERHCFASAPEWTNALKTNHGPRLRRPDPTLDEVVRGRVSHPAEDSAERRSSTADDVRDVGNGRSKRNF